MALLFNNLKAIVRKPAFGLIPMFPSNTSLAWIPDYSGSLATQYAAEAPAGTIITANVTVYTFTSSPRYIVWNGQLLKSGNDFTGTTVITMPVAPNVGDEFFAIL